MGDNIGLDDRDGVRTPMQWDRTLSGGWSSADPGDFYLPVIRELDHGSAAVNVADQQIDESSLLNWMRTLIASRPPEMGTATFVPLDVRDKGVLAFERGDITVLANFTDESKNVHNNGEAVSLTPFGWAWLRNGIHL